MRPYAEERIRFCPCCRRGDMTTRLGKKRANNVDKRVRRIQHKRVRRQFNKVHYNGN